MNIKLSNNIRIAPISGLAHENDSLPQRIYPYQTQLTTLHVWLFTNFMQFVSQKGKRYLEVVTSRSGQMHR